MNQVHYPMLLRKQKMSWWRSMLHIVFQECRGNSLTDLRLMLQVLNLMTLWQGFPCAQAPSRYLEMFLWRVNKTCRILASWWARSLSRWKCVMSMEMTLKRIALLRLVQRVKKNLWKVSSKQAQFSNYKMHQRYSMHWITVQVEPPITWLYQKHL